MKLTNVRHLRGINSRIQRRDRRVQEHFFHRMGRWWSGQDQAFVATLYVSRSMQAFRPFALCPGYRADINYSNHSLLADFQNTQGIIFVVDSNDRDRVAEAREERELLGLVKCSAVMSVTDNACPAVLRVQSSECWARTS